MENRLRFDTVSAYNTFNKHETRHPLVSVVDLPKADPRQGSHMFLAWTSFF